MDKAEAIKIFGSLIELARALGVTPSRISQLPEVLNQKDADRVVGAAVRLGRVLPSKRRRREPAPEKAEV